MRIQVKIKNKLSIYLFQDRATAFWVHNDITKTCPTIYRHYFKKQKLKISLEIFFDILIFRSKH